MVMAETRIEEEPGHVRFGPEAEVGSSWPRPESEFARNPSNSCPCRCRLGVDALSRRSGETAMSEQNRDARPLAAQRTYPTVRAVSFADINEAWAQGLRDFRAAPAYGLVFGGIYAAGGIVVVLGATALGL